MSEGNTWYEAYSHIGTNLPEVKWETAYRPKVEKLAEPTPVAPTLTPSDIQALVQSFVSGSEEEMQKAAAVLATQKPREAINMLFHVAGGRNTKDHERRRAATLTIARMVEPSIAQAVAQGMLNMPKAIELNPVLCMALGIIGHPVALPHLYKILRDGIGTAIFSSHSDEQQKAFAIFARAYALIAIAMIGNRESIVPLVMDVEREFLCQDYSDDTDNALSNSNNLGLALLGVAASLYANKRKNARAAASMVDPDVGLLTLIEFPAETKRAWMLQHRVSVLKALCTMHGVEPLKALMPQAKHSLQRLFISLPVTQLGNSEPTYVNPMIGSSRSSNRTERVLACDGLVKVYTMSKNPQLEPWALAGLNDKDSIVQTATAASLLYNNAGKLVENALALTQAKSVDVRMGVIPPLMNLAIRRESFAVEALDRIARSEPDKALREMVIEFMQDLPEAQKLNDFETGRTEEGKEEDNNLQTAPEPGGPSWSSFTPKFTQRNEKSKEQ